MKFAGALTIAAALAVAGAPQARAQAQLAGEWHGTLSAEGKENRLVLHIAPVRDGILTGTIDSLDQGAFGIPVTSISVKGSAFRMTVDDVHGSYEGTVNKDSTEIDGTWSQGQQILLNFRRAAPQAAPKPVVQPAPPSDIDGLWMGTVDANGRQLQLLFRITNTSSGLTVHMQSPDQSPVWVLASAVKHDGNSLVIEFKGFDASFDGKIATDLNSINGTLTQMGNRLPLVLKRAKE